MAVSKKAGVCFKYLLIYFACSGLTGPTRARRRGAWASSCDTGSAAALTGLAAPERVGSWFPDQGPNPRPLRWKANS